MKSQETVPLAVDAVPPWYEYAFIGATIAAVAVFLFILFSPLWRRKFLRWLKAPWVFFLVFPRSQKRYWIPVFGGISAMCALPLVYLTMPIEEAPAFVRWFPEMPLMAKVSIAAVLPTAWAISADLWRHAADWHVARSSCDRETYYIAYEAIDDIVGMKLRRYGEFERSSLHRKSLEEVYFAVTQPDLQIAAIIQKFYSFLQVALGFSNSLPKPSLELVLVKVGKNQSLSFEQYVPNDSKPSEELLNSSFGESFFRSVLNAKEPQWIPDIAYKIQYEASSLPKYVPISCSGRDCGSIYGYPIKNKISEKIVYILTLKTDKPEVFDDVFAEKFKPIITAFTRRILLENIIGNIRKELHERVKKSS